MNLTDLEKQVVFESFTFDTSQMSARQLVSAAGSIAEYAKISNNPDAWNKCRAFLKLGLERCPPEYKDSLEAKAKAIRDLIPKP